MQEFCCYDSSWQTVLEQLPQRSQVVLMDLGGFGPSHGGCLYELGRLGASAHLRRVVLLADASTVRATAGDTFAAGASALAAGKGPPCSGWRNAAAATPPWKPCWQPSPPTCRLVRPPQLT